MHHRRIALAVIPAAFAAIAPAATEDRFETVSGSVTEFSATRHELAIHDETGADRKFTWTKDTKFNGVVIEGARVAVRYTRPEAGKPAEALSISVLK